MASKKSIYDQLDNLVAHSGSVFNSFYVIKNQTPDGENELHFYFRKLTVLLAFFLLLYTHRPRGPKNPVA